jgi:hypothetical protein
MPARSSHGFSPERRSPAIHIYKSGRILFEARLGTSWVKTRSLPPARGASLRCSSLALCPRHEEDFSLWAEPCPLGLRTGFFPTGPAPLLHRTRQSSYKFVGLKLFRARHARFAARAWEGKARRTGFTPTRPSPYVNSSSFFDNNVGLRGIQGKTRSFPS